MNKYLKFQKLKKNIKILISISEDIYSNNYEDINIKFNEFESKYKAILKDFLGFKIIEFNKNYLFFNGFVLKNNQYFYFSTLNLKKFKFVDNQIYLKKVNSNKDYYSLEKLDKFTILNLNRYLNP